MDSIQNPLLTRPKSVAIVGMGPSSSEYFLYNWKKKGLFRVDEVWGINSTLGSIQAHKTFIMDDLKGIEKRYPEWSDRLKLTKEPIITSTVYPDYPSSVAYPKDDVITGFGNPQLALADGYFLSTPAYAIGYAIATGVQELWLFGCDFSFPGSSGVEAGAQNVAFLLGIAKGRGCLHYRIPGSSTLLDAHLVRQDEVTKQVRYPLYGYDFNPGEAAKRIKMNQAAEGDAAFAARQPQTIKQEPQGPLAKIAQEGGPGQGEVIKIQPLQQGEANVRN